METKNHSTANYSSIRHRFSRRKFLGSCSACALCLGMMPATHVLSLEGSKNASKKAPLIRVIYSLHSEVQNQPDWPNTGFDFRPYIVNFNRKLTSAFRDVEFIPVLATGPEDAGKIVSQDANESIDGYIVFQMNCWNRVIQTVAETKKPVLYVDFKYGGSGGFLVYTASMLRGSFPNVGFVSSSGTDDLIRSAGCLVEVIRKKTPSEMSQLVQKVRTRLTPQPGKYKLADDKVDFLQIDECISRMKNSKILAVRDQNRSSAQPVFGIPVEYIPFSEINDAWSSASRTEAEQIADKWVKNAWSVIDVPLETLISSAAMYLGMKSVLKSHGANAITINCLGGFYGGHIHAYPCLGFYELNNEGLVGGCECDIRSCATMVAFSILSGGRPGFISDPVIDTSKRQIVYAHCVAPNKVFGSNGPENPYVIMTHSEDRNGASVRSILPVNYMVTTLQIHNDRKEILIHRAVANDNDSDDRACRTKLCAEPLGDIEKLFTMWDTWGWHRVTFYGDLKDAVNALAGEMGWKVIEEA